MSDDDSVIDLPEHTDNPFTACLGAPHSFLDGLEILSRTPSFDVVERKLPHHLRRYCVMRLFDFVHARTCQIELIDRIGMLIRGGYRDRNPSKGQHLACILDAADRAEAGKVDMPSSRGLGSRATGLALLGQPGMGKSLTVDLALEAYPKLVTHQLPYSVTQVPWLKIECPSTGGNKQFCVAFFRALGIRVRQDYSGIYGKERRTANEMMLDVQQLCQVHAVGIIVIDELQHAAANKEGPTPLMNFLVTLTNVVGVPVMLVGTMGATPIIEKDFRSARRAAGLGQPTWTRLRQGEEWEGLVQALWKYQWTAVETPYSEEISKALYHECQGIIDILVKLFILAQFRAISIGEGRGAPEVLSPELIAEVAKNELRVIRPMIAALRGGREDLLDQFPDLQEFHHHVAAMISRGARMTMEEFRERLELAKRHEALQAKAPNDPMNSVRALLAARGMAADLIEVTLAQALEREPSRDPIEIVLAVKELVEGRMPSKPKRGIHRAKQAKAGAKSPAPEIEDPDDLRGIAGRAKKKNSSVHTGLAEAGVAMPVSRITAA